MVNKNLNISIIIIGYNTQQELLRLLDSINSMRGTNHILEVVYVDDGSQDNSYKLFEQSNLKIKKVGKKLDKNFGRAYATQAGIDLAKGFWYLFLRSNEIVSTNLILEYQKHIVQKKSIAYTHVVF